MRLADWRFHFLFSARIWARGTTASSAWEKGMGRTVGNDVNRKQELGRGREPSGLEDRSAEA